MKVRVFNKTKSNVYIDLKENDNPNDVIILGVNGSATVDVENEQRLLHLKNKYKNVVFNKEN